MKRSDVFDRQYPSPFDKAVYPFFRAYQKYEKNILEDFKHQIEMDVESFSPNNLEKVRPNILLDNRNRVHFIVTFKNKLSEEQENKLRNYIHFFRTYRSYVEYIQLILHDIRNIKEEAETYGVYANKTITYLNEQLRIYIAITRFLILSFEQNKLSYLHLHYFSEKCAQEFDDEDVVYIDKIITNYQMDDLFGGPLVEENHFHQSVSEHHLNSWYKYFNKIRHR